MEGPTNHCYLPYSWTNLAGRSIIVVPWHRVLFYVTNEISLLSKTRCHYCYPLHQPLAVFVRSIDIQTLGPYPPLSPGLPTEMATPPIFIDGVAVYRKSARYDIRGSKKYRSYPFPSSVLAPGNHASFPIPSLGLKLRIYCPFDSHPECTPHRCPVKSLVYTSEGPEGRPESQGDGPLGDGPFVVFRNDYKPLHPKQVQALWKYLRYFVFRTDHAGGNGSGPRYFRMPITDSTLYRMNLSNGRVGITDTIHSRDWYYEEFEKAYFKLDNFNAFFYITKHRRLVNGDESWRGIMSPYDV